MLLIFFIFCFLFPLLLFLLLRSLSPRQIVVLHRMVSVNLDYASCTAKCVAWYSSRPLCCVWVYSTVQHYDHTWLEYITVQHYDHTAALELGLGLGWLPQLGQNFDQRGVLQINCSSLWVSLPSTSPYQGLPFPPQCIGSVRILQYERLYSAAPISSFVMGVEEDALLPTTNERSKIHYRV